MSIDPLLIGTGVFLLVSTLVVILVARVTASYLADNDDAEAALEESIPAELVPLKGNKSESAPKDGALEQLSHDEQDPDLHQLVAHHDETSDQIKRHRNLLLVFITTVAVIIALALVARALLTIFAYSTDAKNLIELSRDSTFWLSIIGVGAFMQAFAATLLYSLQSFSRQARHSFGALSRIHSVKVALRLIDGLPAVDDPAQSAERDRAKLELIRLLPVDGLDSAPESATKAAKLISSMSAAAERVAGGRDKS